MRVLAIYSFPGRRVLFPVFVLALLLLLLADITDRTAVLEHVSSSPARPRTPPCFNLN